MSPESAQPQSVARPRASTTTVYMAWLISIVVAIVVLIFLNAAKANNDYYDDCSSRWDSYIAGGEQGSAPGCP